MIFYVAAYSIQTTLLIHCLCFNSIRICQCIPHPVTIVAVCSLITPTKKQSDPSYCAVATSDGFVRLYERNATQQDVLVQVGLYPTGERITKMQLLEESPMQLVVGTQSGSVLVYEIV
ncbi:hypothetical protein FGIG_01598 [Fasciola gigantica]|uniref:Uncharacterized protein n=1 Tax=Fasciola gigantica TaxID=46835 RepID=A0A504YPX0_FASGI|nr:hypothetical protein FGIG_01598 [Fasciola gigantica]